MAGDDGARQALTRLEGGLQATSANKKPAVVIVPAWSGYGEHEILRQNFFAEMGYVTMSANIYGLPIGATVSGPERMGFVNK